jgi:lysozyme
MTYTTGVDVSRWQDNNATPQQIDFVKMKSAGAEFVFIKASQDVWTDEDFSYNWRAAKQAGLMRGAYHFYDWRIAGKSPEDQGAYFRNLLANDPGELPPVMDFENPYQGWSVDPFPARDKALDLMQRFKAAVGVEKMILYINPASLKTLQRFPDWLLQDWYLWIAAWPTVAGSQVTSPEQIPANWTPQTYGWPAEFWQYTSKLDGIAYGMESYGLDGNLYIGGAFDKLFQTTSNNEQQGENEMANHWSSNPIGVGLSQGNAVDRGLLAADFVTVDLGSVDGINESAGGQLDAAQALGIPALGVYRVTPKWYVERGSAPWQTWNVDADPYVAHLSNSRYSLDRMVRGIGATKNKYMQGIILDLRDISEGNGVISPYWWLSVAEYFAKVVSTRYKLPWFAFCTKAVADALAAKAGNTSISDFFYRAGTNASLKISALDGPYPVESAKPEFLAPGVDFWLYAVGNVTGVSGTASRWLYNGTLAGMNGLLNFTGAVTPPVVEPPVDPPVDPPDEEPVPSGDYSALLAEARKQTAVLESIAAHLGVRR